MLDLHLIDYEKCHEYARTLCGQFDIPRCDAEDIGSDAFLESIKRAWRTESGGNPEALARRLMYTSTLNVINRRNTHANKMIREADDIDKSHCEDTGEPTDDEIVERRSCETMAHAQNDRREFPDDWQNPFWLRLFNIERQKLRNERSRTPLARMTLKLITAGLKDSRLSLLCAFLQISWGRFQTILNFFKERFALCFQALRAWRAEI